MSALPRARRSLTVRLWALQMAVFIGVGIAMAAIYHHTELAHIDDDLLRQARWLRDSFPPPFDDEHLTKELAEIAVSAQWPIGAMVHSPRGGPLCVTVSYPATMNPALRGAPSHPERPSSLRPFRDGGCAPCGRP